MTPELLFHEVLKTHSGNAQDAQLLMNLN